ncbi:MAG TPA: Gfo/Idh/MocA family oxidoreductase [Candidatus Hydrogenedentes bacterium]|jgi:predicted dehydrogenase|nr:Gfo/Idh/MocA family oxidoreductase [Candidatus Hydrogenedentota bacterium]
MAKKTVNVAMIGASFMGKAHSNAWRKVDMFFDAPVKPVMKVMCGKFEEELATADRWGWQETSLDWKEVVNRPDIDIIDICTPNFLHPIIAIEAAKAGKHIVCEKPLANTLAEAKDMLKAADKAGIKHMCGFSYRFAPAVQTMKKMISSGALGEIFHFRAAYLQDWIVDPDFPMVWRMKKKHTGSGALGDIGAHITDLCHFLVGPVGEVTSALETFIKKRVVADSDVGAWDAKGNKKTKQYDTVDVDDAAVFIGRIKGRNTLASFEATRFAPGRRNFNSIEIYGSKGSLIWNQEDMNEFQYFNRADPDTLQGFRKVLACDSGHPYVNSWWPPGHIIGYEHLFVHEIYEFLCGLKKKKINYPTFEDAVNCQAVLEAVEKAASTRKWEKV